jgi:hypothetical protein
MKQSDRGHGCAFGVRHWCRRRLRCACAPRSATRGAPARQKSAAAPTQHPPSAPRQKVFVLRSRAFRTKGPPIRVSKRGDPMTPL